MKLNALLAPFRNDCHPPCPDITTKREEIEMEIPKLFVPGITRRKMKWIEERAQFQKRFDELSQQNLQGLITDLNTAVGNYIARGGISQDPNNNPDYANIIKLTTQAEGIKQKYSALNDDILKYLSNQSKDNDLSGLLAENGELQKHLNRLEKIKDEMKIDVVSAVARDELLRTRDTDVTKHQLFILDRPVRRGIVPYLWVLSVLFIGAGLVIFKMSAPNLGLSAAANDSAVPFQYMLLDFFSNKVVLSSLLISAIVVIVFLSLKIAGIFGK